MDAGLPVHAHRRQDRKGQLGFHRDGDRQVEQAAGFRLLFETLHIGRVIGIEVGGAALQLVPQAELFHYGGVLPDCALIRLGVLAGLFLSQPLAQASVQ